MVAVWIVALISGDGECNWIEGAQLLAVYFILPSSSSSSATFGRTVRRGQRQPGGDNFPTGQGIQNNANRPKTTAPRTATAASPINAPAMTTRPSFSTKPSAMMKMPPPEAC